MSDTGHDWCISQFRKGDVYSRDSGALGKKSKNFICYYYMQWYISTGYYWSELINKKGVYNALNISEGWG